MIEAGRLADWLRGHWMANRLTGAHLDFVNADLNTIKISFTVHDEIITIEQEMYYWDCSHPVSMSINIDGYPFRVIRVEGWRYCLGIINHAPTDEQIVKLALLID